MTLTAEYDFYDNAFLNGHNWIRGVKVCRPYYNEDTLQKQDQAQTFSKPSTPKPSISTPNFKNQNFSSSLQHHTCNKREIAESKEKMPIISDVYISEYDNTVDFEDP